MAITATSIVEKNKALASHAAVLTAGGIANKQLLAAIRPKLPMTMRGFADHAVAELVIANLASLAVQQYKPDSALAKKVSDAMIACAYQKVIASFDIEGMLDDLLSSAAIKKAFKNTSEVE